MALRKTINTAFGFAAKDAYHRVTSVSWGGKGVLSSFTIASFVDEAAGNAPLAVNTFTFQPDASGGSFVKQAYEFAKTQPEYSDADDC